MEPLLGMAGLAEAAEAEALLIGYSGLFLIGILVTISLVLKSRIPICIALFLAT